MGRVTKKDLLAEIDKYNGYVREEGLSPGYFFYNRRNNYHAVDFIGGIEGRPRSCDNVGCGTAEECAGHIRAWYTSLYNAHERKKNARELEEAKARLAEARAELAALKGGEA